MCQWKCDDASLIRSAQLFSMILLSHNQGQEFSAEREKTDKYVKNNFFGEFRGNRPTGISIISALELITNYMIICYIKLYN